MTIEMTIEESNGYQKLLAAVESDKSRGWYHNYQEKFEWVINQAAHYAEKTGLSQIEILDAWEEKRDYWYMNFYQESNQPKIEGDSVRVFETVELLREAIGGQGFRCPFCKGVSTSPYACDSGLKVRLISSEKKKEICNWKVYGLLKGLGKGVVIFVKSEIKMDEIFMPIAWEKAGGVE